MSRHSGPKVSIHSGMPKVRRRELVTIRMTAAERVDIQRLAYIRGITVATLVREFVARELAAMPKVRLVKKARVSA